MLADGKEIAVAVVAVRGVEIEGVAGEEEFRDLCCGAGDLVCVVLSFTAVKNWWIESVNMPYHAHRSSKLDGKLAAWLGSIH